MKISRSLKIRCSKRAGMPLEEAVRDALGGVQSASAEAEGMDTIEASFGFHRKDLDDIYQKIFDTLGSKAGLSPAYSVNLGDGGFAWLFFNDASGEVELIDANGGPLADSGEAAIMYVLKSWDIVEPSGRSGVNSSKDIKGSADVDSDPQYLMQLADAIEETLVSEFGVPTTCFIDGNGIAIRMDEDADGNINEGYVGQDELEGLTGDLETDAYPFAKEFYDAYDSTYNQDLYSATNTSNIPGQPIMSNVDSRIPEWLLDYYDVITDEEAADFWGIDVNDVRDQNAENMTAYDVKHVAWMEAKDDYINKLDTFDIIEIVEEAGNVFPGTVAGDRLYDSTWEIKKNLGISDEDEDSVSYDEVYRDTNGMLGEPGEEYTLDQLRNYFESERDNDPSLMDYPDFESWWADTRPSLEEVY